MVKIPGFDLDSETLEKLADHVGKTGGAGVDLFSAKLKVMDAQALLGFRHSYDDEQQMFNLIVEAQYHIIAAQRCLEALTSGIADTFKENDLRFGVHFHPLCDDCGVNTDDHDNPDGTEYYMVIDELWAQARKQPVNAAPALPVTATLCIGCLEARLGRQLTPADFQYTIGECSARLRDRKGQSAET
jgi:hypothetical protein